MKKTLKTVLIVLIVLVILGGAIGGYFIWKHTSSYIGRDAALQAALKDAGLNAAAVFDTSVEFDHNKYSAWYDLDFETHGMDYEYSVDAVTGEILYSYSKAENAD